MLFINLSQTVSHLQLFKMLIDFSGLFLSLIKFIQHIRHFAIVFLFLNPLFLPLLCNLHLLFQRVNLLHRLGFPILNFFLLLSAAFRCILLHSAAFRWIPLHFVAPPLHSVAFRCTLLHSVAFRCIPLHSIAFRRTQHPDAFQ